TPDAAVHRRLELLAHPAYRVRLPRPEQLPALELREQERWRGVAALVGRERVSKKVAVDVGKHTKLGLGEIHRDRAPAVTRAVIHPPRQAVLIEQHVDAV